VEDLPNSIVNVLSNHADFLMSRETSIALGTNLSTVQVNGLIIDVWV
jgi:hypothetical protein